MSTECSERLDSIGMTGPFCDLENYTSWLGCRVDEGGESSQSELTPYMRCKYFSSWMDPEI
jgi:hypothetical protein